LVPETVLDSALSPRTDSGDASAMTTLTLPALAPGDAGYDEARRVWNAAIDRHPALIVPCRTTADVVAAVRHARERDLEIGVRCGGHNIAGLAVPDGGLMIDLRPMHGVSVDPVTRRARVQGGAPLGALDRASQRHGLATTAGNVSHTGVGGLTLGGGMGWLARAYGLACDNVVAYTVVTAGGEVVRATAEEHPDLFWGLRGGGGNFGIVVEFEFRLHRVGTRALISELSFGPEHARDAFRIWRDLAARAPRAATFTASVQDGAATLGYVYVGEHGEGLLDELGRARETTPSYLQLQRQDDTVQGHETRRYWKGHYLPELSDAAIDALLAARGVSATLQAHGGAIAEVDDGASAFSHRATAFEYVASPGGWTDPHEDEARKQATRDAAARLEPFARGAYVNVLNGEPVQRAYTPAKLARLTALKDAYDPDNVFHLNHNIRPSR
jgi:FAD/FMN-containing dehydrogenase